MLANKQRRKNHFRKDIAKKRVKTVQFFVFCLKTAACLIAVTLISLILIFCHDCFTQSDCFSAKHIEITGQHRLLSKQIIKTAQIKPEINILSINLLLARKRLIAHPWIKEAEIQRELPNRISIKITEHKPFAVVDIGRRFLVNEQGEIFKEIKNSDPKNLPIISGLQFSDISLCSMDQSTPFNAAIRALKLKKKNKFSLLNWKEQKIYADREMGITLSGFDRVKAVKLGYDNYSNKYDRLKRVLYQLERRYGFSKIDMIDMRNLNRIVVRLEKIEPPTAESHKEV